MPCTANIPKKIYNVKFPNCRFNKVIADYSSDYTFDVDNLYD